MLQFDSFKSFTKGFVFLSRDFDSKLYLCIDAFAMLQFDSFKSFTKGFVFLSRDFDSKLYLCIDAFAMLQFDTFERLTKGFVFPFYVATHLVLLVVLFIAVLQNWR
jgi:hypothetical protein